MKNLRLILSLFLAFAIVSTISVVTTTLYAKTLNLGASSSYTEFTGDGAFTNAGSDRIFGKKDPIFGEKYTVLFDPPLGQIVDCEDGDEYFSQSGYSIVFTGYSHDSINCRTCYYYCIQNNNVSPDISHYTFGDTECDETCLDEINVNEDIGTWVYNNGIVLRNPGGGGRYSTGEDPSTGFCGVKDDRSLKGNEIKKVFLCVDGLHGIGWIKAVFKAGNGFEYVDIPGPEVCEGICGPTGNPEPCGFCDINGPAGPVCPSEVNTFDAQITGICGNPVYSWTITGDHAGFTPNGSSVTVTAGATCGGAYTVSVEITCEDCAPGPVTCQQVIQIGETEAPAITCPSNTAIECDQSSSPENTGYPIVTDNCTDPVTSIQHQDNVSSGNCVNTYTIERIWTATDACGNQSQCTQLIDIADTTPPVISCPADATLDCNEGTSPQSTGTATATDNCTDPVTDMVHQDYISTGNCVNNYTIERTWTATDECGNTSQCIQYITVENTQPLVITCPTDVTLECGEDTSPSATGEATAVENCNGVVDIEYLDNISPGNCAHNYTIERTWTATDACGNQSQCTQLIDVEDNTLPVIASPSNLTLECGQDTSPAATGTATATDNCTDPVTDIVHQDNITPGNCAHNYTIERTWTATDECGNESYHTQMITVEDNTPPVMTGPANVTLDCEEDTSPAVTGEATATDNCTDPVTDIVYQDNISPGNCANSYTIERTWTATDECGNESYHTQMITVEDNTSPVMSCPADVTIDCEEDHSPAATGEATASDNCSNPVTDMVYQDNITPGNCAHNYTIERTWTATDACGNQSQCTQLIEVEDTTPPVMTCPANVTLECGEDTSPAATGTSTATDNCTDPVTDIVYQDIVTPGNCAHNYTIERTWTATDECGNESYRTQMITVEDDTPPVMTCPANVTLECDEDTSPAVTGTSTATDNCTDPVTDIVYQDNISPGNCVNSYTIERTWTATDECGNESQRTQVITIEDNTPPAMTCPADVTIDCEEDHSPATTGTATATDNCTDPVTDMVYLDNITPGNCANSYTIERTWTATDECGHESQCTQIITVEDDTPPAMTGPANVTLDCGEDTTPAATGTATATDNCTDPVTNMVHEDNITPGNCAHSYTIERTWTATDECGNESHQIQIITVEDDTPPAMTCPANVTLDCGEDTSPAATGTATATDNCTDPVTDIVYQDNISPSNCAHNYTIERTWTATDECGNESQRTQVITIEDDTPPAMTCPANVTLDCEEDTSPAVTGEATATDNCTDPVTDIVYQDNISPSNCAHNYTIERIWTATDECGNESQCTQIITVEDDTPPAMTCPADVTIDCEEDTSPAVTGQASAADNCTDPLTDMVHEDIITPGNCAHSYTIERTWTATDECGNESQCTQMITVEDDTPPALTCPADVTIDCEEDTSPAVTGQASAADNCTDPVTDMVHEDIITPGNCAHSYTIERTWTATDECGNESQCTQLITVEDDTPPVMAGPANVTLECGEDTSPTATGISTATDNCTDPVTDMVHEDIITPGNCANNYTIERTWTATDECGNESHHMQIITVEDDTPPAMTCPADVTIDCEEDHSPATTGTATATDNCTDPVTDMVYQDSITPGNCASSYTIVRTWTATDECGNESQCIQTITVEDTTPPTMTMVDPRIAPLGDTTYLQCYGQDPEWMLPEFDESSVATSDNCSSNVTVDYSGELMDEGDCDGDGYILLYRLTWTATDECGNSDSLSVMIALVDNIAPVIHGVPEDITVNCDEIPEPPALVYATDECLCACVVMLQESPLPTACLDGQVMIRTWTASDECGNTTVATQRITLVDNESPQLVMLQPELKNLTNGAIISYTCSYGQYPNLFYRLSAESMSTSETCGGTPEIQFSLTNSLDPDNCANNGYLEQLTAKWTVVNACGYETSMTIYGRLIDNEAPVLFGVPETTCFDDPELLNIYATDNCGIAFTHFWDTNIPNPCGSGEAILRTYEASDNCGNYATETCILVPNENNPPIMEFVNPLLIGMESGDVIQVDCDNQNGGYTSFVAEDMVAVSTCPEQVVTTFSENLIESMDCSTGKMMAIVELKWTSTELCGNYAEMTLEAHVIDSTGPEFMNFQSMVTIGCADTMPVYTTIDNCSDVTLTMKDSTVAGECEFEYVIHRVLTATDDCGNVTTKSQTINVGDGQGPTMAGVEEGVCDDLSMPNVTAYDECTGEFVPVKMVQDTMEVNCHNGMVIIRTWSAVGSCGNVTTIRQTIHMDDDTPPVIEIPWYSVIKNFEKPGMHFVNHSETDMLYLLSIMNRNSVLVTDECGLKIIPKYTVEVFPGDCVEDGFSERRVYTWVATDICGNTTTFSFTVHIIDDIPPVMDSIPADMVVACTNLQAPANIAVNERAGERMQFNQSITPGRSFGEYIVTRTWVATDACGNERKMVQTIIWIPENSLECELIGPDIVDCNSHGVVIGSDVTGGTGPYTYEWEVQGGKCFIQAGQGTPEIVLYVGWSQVKIILNVTDANGCVAMCMYTLDCEFGLWRSNTLALNSDAVDQLVDPDFELSQNGIQSGNITELTYWPNPTDGDVNLSFESAVDHEVQIVFTNLLGQVVKHEQFNALRGFNLHKTNIDFLMPGSYLMQITTANEKYTKVIVVARQ